MKEIEGEFIWVGWQVGAASIIPPTLQKACKYSFQLLKSLGVAIFTFFGRNLPNMFITLSTSSSETSIYFFFKSFKLFIDSREKLA